jgi:hypothetical protein
MTTAPARANVATGNKGLPRAGRDSYRTSTRNPLNRPIRFESSTPTHRPHRPQRPTVGPPSSGRPHTVGYQTQTASTASRRADPCPPCVGFLDRIGIACTGELLARGHLDPSRPRRRPADVDTGPALRRLRPRETPPCSGPRHPRLCHAGLLETSRVGGLRAIRTHAAIRSVVPMSGRCCIRIWQPRVAETGLHAGVPTRRPPHDSSYTQIQQ